MQTSGAQQSSGFVQVSPGARHWHVPSVHAIWPQHSSSLLHGHLALRQHCCAPVAESAQLDGRQHSSSLVHASVTSTVHMPPSGSGGGGGGGDVSSQTGAAPTTDEQSRRRVLRSVPSTQRRRPHASVQSLLALIAAPSAGTIALMWLIGGHAILFGALLIGVGVRMKSWRHGGPHFTTGRAATT